MHAIDNRDKEQTPPGRRGAMGALSLDPMVVRRRNCTQLAEALGVAYGDVLDAKRAGLPMPGNKTTVSAYFAWIEAHPDYREKARNLRSIAPWKGRQ